MSVLREQQTESQSRIDIEILGQRWCLLIENKIYHHQNNPFDTYETYAAQLRDLAHCYFIVLSPSGESVLPNRWRGLSYQSLCRSLRLHLAQVSGPLESSKWLLFAREFVLHLETELYPTMLKKVQIAFVEGNLDAITELNRLREEYGTAMIRQVSESAASIAKDVQVSRESWPGYHLAIRCRSSAWCHRAG